MPRTPDPEDSWRPETLPAMLIATAARLLARRADARLRTLGIGVSQFPVIHALKDGARLSQTDLARLAKVEQPSMAQLLARMERDGLIRRQPDPADRRSSLISLTRDALARIAPGRAILAQIDRELTTGLDAREIETLVALLRHVIANLADD